MRTAGECPEVCSAWTSVSAKPIRCSSVSSPWARQADKHHGARQVTGVERLLPGLRRPPRVDNDNHVVAKPSVSCCTPAKMSASVALTVSVPHSQVWSLGRH